MENLAKWAAFIQDITWIGYNMLAAYKDNKEVHIGFGRRTIAVLKGGMVSTDRTVLLHMEEDWHCSVSKDFSEYDINWI